MLWCIQCTQPLIEWCPTQLNAICKCATYVQVAARMWNLYHSITMHIGFSPGCGGHYGDRALHKPSVESGLLGSAYQGRPNTPLWQYDSNHATHTRITIRTPHVSRHSGILIIRYDSICMENEIIKDDFILNSNRRSLVSPLVSTSFST